MIPRDRLKERRALFCLIVVAVASTLPFFLAAYGRMAEAHDLYIHTSRMMKFDEGLHAGNWYPRWLGGMNDGFGAATTLFYAPAFYYLTSAAHAVTGDWPWAIAIVVIAGAIASALAFFTYVKRIASLPAALIATILYLIFPYRLIDLYHRGAFPELIAFALLPPALLSLRAAIERKRPSMLVAHAFAFAALMITHPPSAYLFALSCVVYCGVLALKSRSWRPLLFMAAGQIAGISLSAFYVVPAIGELRYSKEHVTQSFPYGKAFLNQLLAGTRFQVMIGVMILAGAVTFAMYALLALKRRGAASDDPGNGMRADSIAWSCVGVLSIVMMTPLAKPLTAILPGLEAVAFPWRWLGILGLASAVLAAIAIDRISQSRSSWMGSPGPRAIVVAAAVVTIGGLAYGMLAAGLASNLRKPFAASTNFIEEDFTPRDSIGVRELPRNRGVELIAGGENAARLLEWNPEERTIEVSSDKRDTLHVYSFMFPGWTARIDGNAATIRTNPELGTILVDVEPGFHVVRLTFENTPIRRAASILSAGVLVSLILIWVYPIAIRKKRMSQSSQ